MGEESILHRHRPATTDTPSRTSIILSESAVGEAHRPGHR